ncbi:MAG: hypothetical protein PHS52_03755 [Desulfotomaculaceae bacterium]|nr:hypothetical protein [Desulfotomaculaceae bacterium]
MQAYIGNAENIDLYRYFDLDNIEADYMSFSPVDWKQAQFALENKDKLASREQLYGLCCQLFDRVLSNPSNGKRHLNDVAYLVIDWFQDISYSPIITEGNISMCITSEEKWFINRLLKDTRTKYVYSFTDNGLRHVWAVVDTTSAELEYEYSSYFTESINKFNDFYCDFMVFSDEEIKSITLPNNVYKYNNSEG